MKVKKGTEPDCDDCLPPLSPGNEDVFLVYSLTSNQLIVSAGGDLLDVNLCAVETAIRMLGIPSPRDKYVFFRALSAVRSGLKGYREEKKQHDMMQKTKANASRARSVRHGR